MSEPAKSVYEPNSWQLLHLPAETLSRLRREGPKQKPDTAGIDTAALPAASQLALISISGHPLCRIVTARMRASTIRFNASDFDCLRALHLAERGEGDRWHRLTDAGKACAIGTARRIALELGLHETWATGSIHHHTVHCTCGWSTRLYSRKTSAYGDHAERVTRHLAEAAKAVGETG
jgi:hypothetical protein